MKQKNKDLPAVIVTQLGGFYFYILF